MELPCIVLVFPEDVAPCVEVVTALCGKRHRRYPQLYYRKRLIWAPSSARLTDQVPLVDDGTRRRSRIIVSYGPNTLVFRLVSPRTGSSGDPNLMGEVDPTAML